MVFIKKVLVLFGITWFFVGVAGGTGYVIVEIAQGNVAHIVGTMMIGISITTHFWRKL